ncbi:undecaprenyl-diphosphate phosphatase [Candidatus Bathyarchaeota archaeon]|nr:undecaprenyl-diphosphate phosphatase [Candidatus Bathyarchaeota archaeon]
MASITESLIIGALQGLLEWLPVSSEGNLVLVLVSVLGLEPAETLRLAIVLHLGTGVAALIYLRRDVWDIMLGATEENRGLRLKLAVITGLTGAVGLPIYLALDVSAGLGEALLALTGLALIVTGVVQRGRPLSGERDASSLDWGETVTLGIVQGLAIIPGLSRSGVTTSTLLFRGFSGGESLRLSFLMSIPASFAASLGLMAINGFEFTSSALVSVVAALVVGYSTMGTLIGLAERTSFWKICIGLGALALLAFVPSLVGYLV